MVSLAEEDHLRTYNWWRNCRLLGCFYPPFLSSFLSFYPRFVLSITIIPSYKTILACKSSTYCLTRSSFFLPNEQPFIIHHTLSSSRTTVEPTSKTCTTDDPSGYTSIESTSQYLQQSFFPSCLTKYPNLHVSGRSVHTIEGKIGTLGGGHAYIFFY